MNVSCGPRMCGILFGLERRLMLADIFGNTWPKAAVASYGDARKAMPKAKATLTKLEKEGS